MIVLYILAMIVAIILLIMFMRVNLILAYDTKPQVKARVLFVTVDILKLITSAKKEKPKKKKKIPSPEKKTVKKEKPKGSFEDFTAFIDLIISLVRMLGENISKSLTIHLKRLTAVISSDSPDKTALRYATVSNTVAVLLELIPNTVRKFKCNHDKISIYPDYLAEKCSFAVEVVFTMKVWQMIRILFGSLNIFNENTRKRISERNRTKA